MRELGDAVDAARHFFAEFLAHLLDGDAGVFHDVVQQAGLHGDQIHAHVGQDVRHHQRVRHVGLAGIARLAFVILAREAKGFFEGRQVVLGPILADFFFQLAVKAVDRIGRGNGQRRRRRNYRGWFGEAGGIGGHCSDCNVLSPTGHFVPDFRTRRPLPLGYDVIATWLISQRPLVDVP